MSKFLLKAASTAIVAAAAFATVAAEAAPASANGTGRARVLKQITVTNTSDLDFGTVVAGASASTVAVSAAGVRTCGAGLTCTGAGPSANFNVPRPTAVVTVAGDNSVTLANGSGGTMSAALTRSASTLTLVAGAVNGTFQVAGTLSLAASQADGAYTGTFNVSVDYQ